MRCAHCDTRLDSVYTFTYNGHDLCCGCMSALCSWLLDGGQVEAPEMFAYVIDDDHC